MLSCEVALIELTCQCPPINHPTCIPSLPSSIHEQHFPSSLHYQLVIIPLLEFMIAAPSFDSLCASPMDTSYTYKCGNWGEAAFLRMMFPFSWKASIRRLVNLIYLPMSVTWRGGVMVHFLFMLLWWNQWRLRGGVISLHHFIHEWMGCQKMIDSSYHSDTGGRLMPDWKTMHQDYLIIIFTVF